MVARVGVALLLLLITPNVLTAERVTRFIPSSVISFLPRLQLPLPLSALSSFFPSFSPWRSGTRTYSLSTSFRNDVAFIFPAAARGLRVRKFRAKKPQKRTGNGNTKQTPSGPIFAWSADSFLPCFSCSTARQATARSPS